MTTKTESKSVQGFKPATAIAAEIEAEYQAARQSAATALEHAYRCGDLLIEAKTKIGRGKWLAFLKGNTSIGERQAQNYMRLAKHKPAIEEAKAQRDSDLPVREAISLLASPKPEKSLGAQNTADSESTVERAGGDGKTRKVKPAPSKTEKTPEEILYEARVDRTMTRQQAQEDREELLKNDRQVADFLGAAKAYQKSMVVVAPSISKFSPEATAFTLRQLDQIAATQVDLIAQLDDHHKGKPIASNVVRIGAGIDAARAHFIAEMLELTSPMRAKQIEAVIAAVDLHAKKTAERAAIYEPKLEARIEVFRNCYLEKCSELHVDIALERALVIRGLGKLRTHAAELLISEQCDVVPPRGKVPA